MASIYDLPTNITNISNPTGNIIVDSNIPDAVTPLDVDLLRFKPHLPPIDYTNLDFSAIKLQLLNLLRSNASKLGYSVRDFADSNTAGMFLNLMAYMGQMISYHTDAMVNELFLDTAQSSYSVSRILNLFKYKPSRPKQGVIMLKVVRQRSTASTQALRAMEDSSDIIFSSSLVRRKISCGGESFEIFPVKILDGVFTPDYLGDFAIPAYRTLSVEDPDSSILEQDLNTYTCFALSGSTRIEDFRSNGQPNQVIQLNSSPVMDSDIIVQVQNTNINIPGKYVYDTWGELSYLALSGFRQATEVGATKNLGTPYLIAPFKLSDEMYAKKQNSSLEVGTLLAIDYNQTAILARYEDFVSLNVPYKVGIVTNINSEYAVDDRYVDLLLYHPSYIYPRTANNEETGLDTKLVKDVYSVYNESIPWTPGDILYLLESKIIIKAGRTYIQPQIVSDTQIQLADPAIYPDIRFLKDNPRYKLAVGKVTSNNTIAFGLSADVDTYYEAETVYEVNWSGNFQSTINFGDGQLGKIPANSAAIKVIYRINDTNTYGYVVKPGEINQSIKIGNTNILLGNETSSSPSISGETADYSRELVSRFFASQDRAVGSADYLTLIKRYSSSYKPAISLAKADADGSIIRIHCLSIKDQVSVQPLTSTEKYQLRNYLNQYKCFGVDIEIMDGSIRKLDIRIDAKVKAGYLTGQVKNELTIAVNEFFALANIELGMGLNATNFLKAVSNIAGVKSLNIYVGGYASVVLADGTEVVTGIKTYKHLKDIPNYMDSVNEFPKLVSEYEVILGAENPIKPYEIIVLDTLNVNVLT